MSRELRHVTARIVIRGRDENLEWLKEHEWCIGTEIEHLVSCTGKDIAIVAPSFIGSVLPRKAASNNIEIMCPLDEEVDLSPVLDAAEEYICDGSSFILHRCRVDRLLYERLLRRWPEVTFVDCEVEDIQQRSSKLKRACTSISFMCCRLDSTEDLSVGCASWPQLRSINLRDQCPYWASLTRTTIKPRLTDTAPSGIQVSDLLRAFWNTEIEELSIFNVNAAPDLSQLSVSSRLNSVDASDVKLNPGDLEWISKHPKVEHLSMTWSASDSMPWNLLKSMPKLNSIDVSSTPLIDPDLAEILDHTSLRTISLYYTQTTPASWKRILSDPNLKSVWVSMNMLEGERPTDLPAKTGLMEAVALNASTKILGEILKGYPDVEIVQM